MLTDEAHRTQYGSLAANMRKALPNAAFFGFTGTPIDKKDRSTLQTFGPYIDTYTIEQAVADGATVPIFYESRLPELRILGNSLDALFDRVFADRSKEEREAIKKKYANEASIAGAPKRIEAVCLDLIEHFTQFIQPNGFKAQLVTCSREVAVLYKETLDRLNGPESAIIISGSNDDEAHLVRHQTDKEQRTALINRFLKPSDNLSILVVCDMLITGFDAPIEQVMYLDSPLKEHTLLQAIARVNRVYDETKTYGLIVDYWGVSEALQEALAIFAPGDIKGALTPKSDELCLITKSGRKGCARWGRGWFGSGGPGLTCSLAKCECLSYNLAMFKITMSAKGQFVLPKAVREHLKLLPGSKVDVTVDTQNRLILTPVLYEPEALLTNRPPVKKVVSVEGMDRAIRKYARGQR